MVTRAACLLLVAAGANGARVTISETSLRLQPGVTFELVAKGASGTCFEWVSARQDIVEIVGEPQCDGASSAVKVRTHAPSSGFDRSEERVFAFVTATPQNGDATEAVKCEVNVARIASLQVETVVRKMLMRELQWLRLGAHDRTGNAFSPQAVAALDIDWKFDGTYLEQIKPSETRQALEEALAAADEGGRWSHFSRIAVRAGTQPKEALDVTATLRNAADGDGGKRVSGKARLSIEPSEFRLLPERAVIAPSMGLQYALRTCSTSSERCSEPAPSAVPPQWSVDPSPVGSISGYGALLAEVPGEAKVQVSQLLDEATSDLLVTPPVELKLELIERRSLEHAEPSWIWGGAAQTSTRLLRLSVLSDKRVGGRPLMLPPERPTPADHLMPKLAISSGGEVVELKQVPAFMCGEVCTLERCTRSGGNCNGGEAPHALCICGELREKQPGDAKLLATLEGSPESLGEQPWPNGGSWSRLTTELDVSIVRALSLLPKRTTLPWVCSTSSPPSMRVLPLPAVAGGSGRVRWEASASRGVPHLVPPQDDDASLPPSLTVQQPSSLELAVHDLRATAMEAVLASVTVERIAALKVTAPSATVAVGAAFDVTILFLSAAGKPISFDVCDGVELEWKLDSSARAFASDGTSMETGLLGCEPRCASTSPRASSSSCATVRLSALTAGPATLVARFASRCSGEDDVVGTLDLTAFALPPPQVAHLCTTRASDAPAVHVISPIAPALRSAALAGSLTLPRTSGLLTVQSPAASQAGEEGDAGELMLPMRCTTPHKQAFELTITYAPSMPPVAVPVEVRCGLPLSAGSDGAIDVGVGDELPLTIVGAWEGAPVAVEAASSLFDSSTIEPLAEGEALQRKAAAAAAASTSAKKKGGKKKKGGDDNVPPSVVGYWQSGLTGMMPGTDALKLTAGSSALECARMVPIRVRIIGFVVSCPSSALLLDAAMLCYALVRTSDGTVLPPSVDLLAGMSFEWAAAGGSADAVRAEPLADAASASSASSLSGALAVKLTAAAVGSAKLQVVAKSADGERFAASTDIDVLEPLPFQIAPPLAPLHGATPALVPPEASVPLLKAASLLPSQQREPVSWSFCSATGSEGAGLTKGGVLRSGSALGWLCVRGAISKKAPQHVHLGIEVAAVAQIRLVNRATGTLFDGGVRADGGPTTVCATAFDALGQPFLEIAMPEGWLAVSAAPKALVASLSVSGSCAEIRLAPEWLQAAGKPPLVLLEATTNVPATSPLLAARAYVPLWREVERVTVPPQQSDGEAGRRWMAAPPVEPPLSSAIQVEETKVVEEEDPPSAPSPPSPTPASKIPSERPSRGHPESRILPPGLLFVTIIVLLLVSCCVVNGPTQRQNTRVPGVNHPVQPPRTPRPAAGAFGSPGGTAVSTQPWQAYTPSPGTFTPYQHGSPGYTPTY